MIDLLRDFNDKQKRVETQPKPKKVDYWGEYDSFSNDQIEVIPAVNSPDDDESQQEDNLSAVRDEAPTPKPITYREETGEVTDTFADDFSDDPVVHGKATHHEAGLR